MKKLLSLLLAALMLAPLCFAAPADAAAKVNISVDAIGEVARGTSGAELRVRVSASPRWSALQATVEFDPAALSFVSFALNPELQRQIFEGEPCIFGVNAENAASGRVSFGYASAFVSGGAEGYYPGDCDYFGTLCFNVRADAPLGATAVALTVTELSRTEDDEPVPVAYSVTDGGMTIVCAHNWQTEESVPASCEADGYARFICPLCGDEYTEEYAATGHAWGEWEEVKSPGCLQSGIEARVCASDPEHIERRFPAPLGHSWGEWETVSEATCTAREVQRRVCERDGTHIETREVGEPDPENGHAWGEWETVSEATCAAREVQRRVCERDGTHIETREVGDFDLENGHAWGEWTQTKEPGCLENGEETRVCANDPEHTERRMTDPLGHAWGEWETVSEATCAAREVQRRVCERDGTHIETREVGDFDPENGHAWGEWVETSPATCTEAAVETRICLNDPTHTETREGRAALDHAWGEWSVTADANCVRGAIETRVCARDETHTETRETGDPVKDAHDWGEWEVTVPVTVFSDGKETRVCRNDPSHIETRVIPRPEYVVCDVDFDGAFTVSDALHALRIAAGLDAADELTRAAADADFDGEVTVADALAALRKALGLVP